MLDQFFGWGYILEDIMDRPYIAGGPPGDGRFVAGGDRMTHH